MILGMEWTRTPVVLLLCWIAPVTAHVLPPANVTLQCHNFRNVLYWNYSQISPELRFRVFVGALSRHYDPVWVDPSNLSADLSFLHDPKDDYFIHVSAVIGENVSARAPPGGIKFSYFMHSPSNRTCSVDLPPVNVTVHPGGIKFSFQHPSLLYDQLLDDQPSPTKPARQRRRQKNHRSTQIKELTEFKYHVVTDPKKEHYRHDFSCLDSVCEEELPLDVEQETYCLRINGHWEGVDVRATQEYCTKAQTSSNNYIALYVVLPLLACLVIGLIFFMVFRKQTSSLFSLPASMKLGKFMGKAAMTPEQPQISQVQASSPTGTPLLSSDIGDEPVQGETPVDDDLRLRIGVPNQDGSTSGGTGESLKETEGSGYMSGGGLDGDKEEREVPFCSESYGNSSGYEQRARLADIDVELVPGDKVKGYQG
ncbi:growth/differentiation factor 10b [Myripristis murdjan]|uniref:Fibronectin type-III domain-containing protein n=1 Tax=Myripristis murdjan TaxID=586833 RepID=A0A667ZFI9_9TELE|nr:interferon gamma receptor 1 [Myripristis murdjan]